MLRCAVSVDLDEIRQYRAIHGLAGTKAGEDLVYDLALPRFLDLASELQLKLTLFVVAEDLARPRNVDVLRRAVAEGHEIGNHSRHHLYDLVRRSRDEQRDEVAGAAADIEREVGVRPRGFRAPGYTVSDGLLEVVREAGHDYDSSVFPCASYYAAKAMALLVQRVGRRRSRAILDTPRVLAAPMRPYRLGRTYTEAGQGLLELPIQVTRGPRLPFIGTGLILAGSLGAAALTRLVVGEPFVNLELHGIDLLDARDGLGELGGYQPDLRVSVARKRQRLTDVLARLGRAGYSFGRLEEIADGAKEWIARGGVPR
jgi:hypothetical protein